MKYPSTAVIKEALLLYQEALRKPVHVVFCLDYSGSMFGDRIIQLQDAMDFILTDRAASEMLQFTGEDIIDVIPFGSEYNERWHAENEQEIANVLTKIKEKEPTGGTALYPATREALKLLKDEDRNKYNTSIIVMTDGEGNIGNYEDLAEDYNSMVLDIPIYSIKFAAADERQLRNMARLSNGKVFDGTTSLVDAFTEVRGYN